MFFVPHKDEAQSVRLFRQSCSYNGLQLTLSKKAVGALKDAVVAAGKKKEVVLGTQDFSVLSRRGLVRITHSGEIVVTQLGLLVLALAEAAGLITSDSSAAKVKVT